MSSKRDRAAAVPQQFTATAEGRRMWQRVSAAVPNASTRQKVQLARAYLAYVRAQDRHDRASVLKYKAALELDYRAQKLRGCMALAGWPSGKDPCDE